MVQMKKRLKFVILTKSKFSVNNICARIILHRDKYALKQKSNQISRLEILYKP